MVHIRTQFFVNRRLLFCFVLMLLMPVLVATNSGVAYAKSPAKDISVSPTPQQLKVIGDGFPLTPVVGLVTGEHTDPEAIREVIDTLHSADVKRIVRNNDGTVPNTPVTIWVGMPSENPVIKEAIQALGVEGPDVLKNESYVLASGLGKDGKKRIVLAGKDTTGTFYAAQTFDQLLNPQSGRDWVPGVTIRDWPKMPLRGVIEGFYGKPWSHEDRLSQMKFYGENKLNTYVYAPKDDPYHLSKWREPYPENRLNLLKGLVEKAEQNHVQFVFGLSPGTSVCYSGNDDFALLMDKMQSMYDIGVRSFAIFLDDISQNLRCESDQQKFGDEPSPAAAAQAFLLNRFQQEFIATHENTNRLITVPTEYSGTANTIYQQQFAELVDQKIIVDWTGPAVVSHEITSEQAQEAADMFGHDLLLWDNYPVNDFDTSRLFLGPLMNRDPDLTEHGVLGITANPLIQAEASKIALYTVADYTWNPDAYDPLASWKRSLTSFGGDAAEDLKTFAENTYSSRLNDQESLTLSPLIEELWTAYESDDVKRAATRLLDEFQTIEQAPTKLRNNLDNENFLKEASPWLEKLTFYGKAGQAAVKMLTAQLDGEQEKAQHFRAELDTILAHDTIELDVTEPLVATRSLDGINTFRGAGELIQYTPEFGDTTGTNIWGYEITVVDGKVVAMGGNNSPIPDNGYVLSIHVSNWLKSNAIIGAKSSVENGKVTLTIPEGVYTIPNDKVMAPGVIQPFIQKAITIYETRSAADAKSLIQRFVKEGEFSSDDAVRALTMHLTAVSQYEEQDLAEKVVKHMKGFKLLLDQQKEQEAISERAYDVLGLVADSLIKQWQ
ncbi:beta-N-acetylhexosaminidase [Virgibacillus phasianinus]|uniref:Beta-N-acetylhexosaminidase n=1 Tax=Virgibacillus phasianinus TaxID=2017483 RepID=A0A220U231_9BACI|nr:beta-N-acetylglucosaminidase domain-containing protein [Virgibacillus phasianinus]ASK62324.1 beta-N-acetylhexosaminidase [Virgibacillus phasianinus]